MLLIPGKYKIDVFNELRKIDKIAVLAPVMHELEKLSESRGKKGLCARVAKEMIKRKRIKIIKTDKNKENVDKAILDYALRRKTAVATNDKKLIKNLKKHNIKVIRFRQIRFFIEG